MTHHASKKGPDIVLVGDGGVTIASGFGSYADSGDNATIEVTLAEDLFYHVPEDVDDIRYDTVYHCPTSKCAHMYQYQTNTISSKLFTNMYEYNLPARTRASDYKNVRQPRFVGRRVQKQDFMKILGSLEKILIRGKYHTDQLEGT